VFRTIQATRFVSDSFLRVEKNRLGIREKLKSLHQSPYEEEKSAKTKRFCPFISKGE
jgi:hypothetical protein